MDGANFVARLAPWKRELAKAPADFTMLAGEHISREQTDLGLEYGLRIDPLSPDYLLSSARIKAILGRGQEAVFRYRLVRALVPNSKRWVELVPRHSPALSPTVGQEK